MYLSKYYRKKLDKLANLGMKISYRLLYIQYSINMNKNNHGYK